MQIGLALATHLVEQVLTQLRAQAEVKRSLAKGKAHNTGSRAPTMLLRVDLEIPQLTPARSHAKRDSQNQACGSRSSAG